MNYRVITVTSNLEEYPECREDNERYPEFLGYIEDELLTIVLEEGIPGRWWEANEFFDCEEVTEFIIPTKSVEAMGTYIGKEPRFKGRRAHLVIEGSLVRAQFNHGETWERYGRLMFELTDWQVDQDD